MNVIRAVMWSMRNMTTTQSRVPNRLTHWL